MTNSLYQRLGGTEGITKIASDVVDLHLENPRISPRYASFEPDILKHGAATFFVAGTGGPSVYEGKDMLSVHKGMNIDPGEFMAVIDDIMLALEKNNIGKKEQEEVLYVLYSMRSEIVGV